MFVTATEMMNLAKPCTASKASEVNHIYGILNRIKHTMYF
jgi:hypothetical protein